MSRLQPTTPQKKFIKVALITVGVCLLIVAGLHIWFVNNARGVIKTMVTEKSRGKLKMELSEISFDFFSNKIKIRQADLFNTDSTSSATTYHVKFRKLTLRVGSFWSLLLQRKLILDSIKLHDPEIEVMQWRKDTVLKTSRDELSISQEMGKLYNSMLDALEDFGIRRIIVNNAKLSLINKMKRSAEPVQLTDIYFDLVRTASGKKKRDEFVENEQSIELRTTNQNIALPGGRHRLSFKKFHLELFQKIIELDSCTITAAATDSSKSSYVIFFKKLLLKGVDFDAMYRKNLIRADSVYCENPSFNIQLNTSVGSSEKKERPNPDKIIQDLTGDLDLAFVGVKDAGIHINIVGKKERSLFNSNKDDFEMRGLRINSDSSKPVVVQRFEMLVRDYRLYNEDSSAAYTFDSIHFQNNKIVLSNFIVSTEQRGRLHNYRDFRIPYFQLTGLDWYSLVFDQNLVAKEAVLYNPVIKFASAGPAKVRKKKSMFASLASLDELITLNKIEIINGQLNMKLSPTTSFDLQNVNLNIFSNRLLGSTNKEGLKQAIEKLSFSNGAFHLKTISAKLNNVRYTGTNLLQADRLDVVDKKGNVNAVISSLVMKDLLLDDASETMSIEGLRWGKAVISLRSVPGATRAGKGGNIILKDIGGQNTRFRFSNGSTTAATFIQSFSLASLTKRGTAAPKLQGLAVQGNNLSVNAGPTNISAQHYAIKSNGTATAGGFQMSRFQTGDSIFVQAPALSFTMDINQLLAKDLHVTTAFIQSPKIKIAKWSNAQKTVSSKEAQLFRIDQFTAKEPVLHIAHFKNDSATIINLPYSTNSVVTAGGIAINGSNILIASLAATTTAATFVKKTGEVMGVEKGQVAINLSDVQLSKKDGVASWSAVVNSLDLQNPNNISFGKKGNLLSVERASAGNVRLSSEYVSNFEKLLKFNVSAWLRTATGVYSDSTTTLKWYNAAYNSDKKQLSLDSFSYYPTQPRDSVIARSAFQTDYITFHSGAINLSNFNLAQYEKDSSIVANTLTITNPIITTYRDKEPPFLSGIIKPLPVDIIKKIGLPLNVKKVNLVNGTLLYTERNAKTRAEGTLALKRMNVTVQNIKNRNFKSNDSLSLSLNAFLMDSAEINLRVKESYTDTLSGFLMTLRMKPTSLSFLNPVLAPLSNVIITSGTIDSFQLRAIGKEDLSLGEMKMYYHDLKIKLVKDGNADKSSFGGRVASFLANALFIHKNNDGRRTGLVYFERLRDRSFFNYIVKMTFSGMATSIGVVKNKKYLKKYKKGLAEKNLPPIDFELSVQQ